MFRRSIFIAAAGLAMTATADAQGKGKGKVKGGGQPAHVISNPSNGGCPPGLAKKDPPCMPPGLAKAQPDPAPADGDEPALPVIAAGEDGDVILTEGHVIDGPYTIVTDPFYYGLDPMHEYYRVGDHFYRVDPETRRVIRFIGVLEDLVN